MLQLLKKITQKAGLPPGDLVHVGDRKVERVSIIRIEYDGDILKEEIIAGPELMESVFESSRVNWIIVNGLHEVDIIERIGRHFGIHNLVLEDILNTVQRPKMDVFEEYAFIVMSTLLHGRQQGEIRSEQVSIILHGNTVITFLEGEDGIFDGIRERIRNGKGRIRGEGADYLVYVILDTIVDHYFFGLEAVSEKIETLEEELITDPSPGAVKELNRLKRDAILLRKSAWPLRDVLNSILRDKIIFIGDGVIPYFRDVSDHIIQIIDIIATIQDMLSGMLDIYLSSVSNRMNEVMKVLTIIATIFIPLTFIAGIYGMNFKYMPELEWHSGYFLVLAVMGFVGGIMFVYFRRKRWL